MSDCIDIELIREEVFSYFSSEYKCEMGMPIAWTSRGNQYVTRCFYLDENLVNADDLNRFLVSSCKSLIKCAIRLMDGDLLSFRSLEVTVDKEIISIWIRVALENSSSKIIYARDSHGDIQKLTTDELIADE